MNKQKNYITMTYLILITLVDFMGLGIVVTLFPKLLLDPSMHMLPLGWGQNTRIMCIGIFLAVYPLGQFFGAAILGKLSDRYGRKPLFTLTLLGTLLGFVLSGLSIYLHQAALLFLGRLIAGIFAGNTAIAQASMIDISTDKSKAKNISILQITLGFAWVIGPPLGGWLSQSSVISWFTYSTPFWLISLLLVAMLIFNMIGYHDTLKVKNKDKLTIFQELIDFKLILNDRMLLKAFTVWAIFVSGWWLFEAYLPTYLQQQWLFSPAIIGTFLGCMGATYATVQLIILHRISKLNPYNVVASSLVISGVAVAAIAICHQLYELIIVIGFYVASMAFALPGLITSISNLGNKENQGHVMGMTSSIQAFSTVTMMLIGGMLFALNQAIPILGGGFLLILAWALYISLMPHKKQTKITDMMETANA